MKMFESSTELFSSWTRLTQIKRHTSVLSAFNFKLLSHPFVGSMAERVKAQFLWRPCDLGLTPTLINTLLRPWIRHFTILISAWWLRTSSKLSGKKSKETTGKLGNGQFLSRYRFIQNIAPPSLSHGRRLKMQQNKTHI